MGDETEKRPYTMSEKALEARRKNALQSTGPKTEAGKAASARNAYVHGMRSQVRDAGLWKEIGLGNKKPCKSSCHKFPCSLVDEGVTQPGQDCMDKQVYVQAFEAIVKTIEEGDLGHLAGVQAHQLAAAQDILNQMQEAIRMHGAMIAKPIISKAGEVILNPDSGEPYHVYVPNPLIVPYFKMLGEMGVTFTEQMLTPKAVSKVIDEEEGEDALAGLFERMGRVADKLDSGRTLEGEVEDAEIVNE